MKDQTHVFNDVINDVYEEVTKGIENLKSRNEVIINPINDHIDSIFITQVLNDQSFELSEERRSLLMTLSQELNSPLEVNLTALTKGQKFQLIDNKIEIKKYDFSNPNYVGSSTISKIVFNRNFDKGIFYLDFQFGKDLGSGGFIIELEKSSDKWSLYKVLPLWK